MYPKVCNYNKETIVKRKISRNEKIVVTDSPNGEHTFNRFEEKSRIEKYKCHFWLADLKIDDLFDIAVPAIEK